MTHEAILFPVHLSIPPPVPKNVIAIDLAMCAKQGVFQSLGLGAFPADAFVIKNLYVEEEKVKQDEAKAGSTLRYGGVHGG